jgi:hypothetical protein
MKKIKTKTIMIVSAVGVGLATLAVVGYKIAKRNKQSSQNSYEILDEVVKNAPSDTISAATAKDVANKLYEAMRNNGTDTDLIKSLLVDTTRTSNDLRMVVAAFGVKKYNLTGDPLFDWMGKDLDLIGWLNQEVSGELLTQLKAMFKQAGFNM